MKAFVVQRISLYDNVLHSFVQFPSNDSVDFVPSKKSYWFPKLVYVFKILQKFVDPMVLPLLVFVSDETLCIISVVDVLLLSKLGTYFISNASITFE